MVREQKQKTEDKQGVQYVEREVTLSLLNEKINYIIGKLEKQEVQEEDEED